jgi:L-2-hydroxyglutarate oxidase LhgO
MSSFSVKVPNGKYVAKLHFCETFEGITGKGDRVFTVNVQNGQKIFKDLDVFAAAGGANKALVETVPVDVTTGVFKIDFVSNVENPQINAIELAPAL